MHLLFFEWNAFMQKDIEKAFEHMDDVSFDMISYEFKNLEEDAFFEETFPKKLTAGKYDAVFSVNFFPLVARISNKMNITYYSLIYDAPLNINDYSSLALPCCRVHLFDRAQYDYCKSLGMNTVFHTPLCVDTSRIDELATNSTPFFDGISFIGRLYKTNYPDVTEVLPDNIKQYLEDTISLQFFNYDNYILDERLPDNLVGSLNAFYTQISGGSFSVNKRQLEFLLASEVTRRERLSAINALSQKGLRVNLYTNETVDIPNVTCLPPAKYYTEMPVIFNRSAINLNVTLRIIKSGIPLRCMDILGSGGLLMSNYQKELSEHFTDGVEIVMYKNLAELTDKASELLTHPDKAVEIARKGKEKAHAEHELYNRLRAILKLDSANNF